jgi:hypothetical protein
VHGALSKEGMLLGSAAKLLTVNLKVKKNGSYFSVVLYAILDVHRN